MKNIVCGGNTRINTESMAVSSRLVKQCLHFPTFRIQLSRKRQLHDVVRLELLHQMHIQYVDKSDSVSAIFPINFI